MGLIPDDVVSEIRGRADIVSVIGQHVSLRKAGRNFKGLCPFHNEKTPSFNVNAERGFFYCFGCHKKGDVFTFVMEYEGKSFVEAAESLAARAGVDIPRRQESPADRRQRSERSRMLEVNRLATEFFRRMLADDQRGAAARSYLEGRSIGPDMAAEFQLGYAPDGWSGLGDFLAESRVSAELAVKLGLIVRRPNAGGYYDRFRHRLMCPVILPGGEIAGFSGRLLDGGSGDPERAGAKYINSPESPVYKKSRLLFGLHRARSAFRKTGRAVLVEGNFDVISLHQAGFEEAVAPLGTALTDDQVDALRRLADEVALLYDGDRAGRIATRKALETLVEADVPVKIARLPAGEDPDSMVHRDDPEGGSDGGGVAELRRILDRAQPGPEYFIREVWRHAGDSADGRTRALGAAARVIQKVANPVKRDLITGTLASAMDVDIDTARRALRDAARPDARRGRDERGGPDRDGRPGADAPGPAAVVKPPPYFELQLLAILADHPQLLKTAEEHNVVSLLTDARLRDMYCAACQGSPMLAAAPDDIGPIAARHMLSGAYATMKDPNQGLLEVIASLRHPRRRLAQLQRQADEARRRGDEALERELVHEILTTRRQVD